MARMGRDTFSETDGHPQSALSCFTETSSSVHCNAAHIALPEVAIICAFDFTPRNVNCPAWQSTRLWPLPVSIVIASNRISVPSPSLSLCLCHLIISLLLPWDTRALAWVGLGLCEWSNQLGGLNPLVIIEGHGQLLCSLEWILLVVMIVLAPSIVFSISC